MLATRHLIELGHRRIAFIAGILDHPDATERFKGYRRALADAGIAHDPKLVVPGDFHEEGGVEATLRLLNSGTKFTALFCVNDQTAYGACLALYRSGLSVPRDVSVVGFDDLHASYVSRAAADHGASIHSRVGRKLRRGHAAAVAEPAAEHFLAAGRAHRARVHRGAVRNPD